MKSAKSLCAIIFVAVISLTLVFVGGVKAAWHYSLKPSDEFVLDINISVFAWQGSDELPDDEKVGENHIALIERITLSDFGLNNQSSFLSQYIASRIDEGKDTVSSVAPTPGGNLKSLFNTSEMQKLDFMIQVYTDSNGMVTGYELYTFETALVGNKIGTTVNPVYKTILALKNGDWLPETTMTGKSVSMRYDAKQGGTRITINPAQWERVTPVVEG